MEKLIKCQKSKKYVLVKNRQYQRGMQEVLPYANMTHSTTFGHEFENYIDAVEDLEDEHSAAR
jgi:hypothetical protein